MALSCPHSVSSSWRSSNWDVAGGLPMGMGPFRIGLPCRAWQMSQQTLDCQCRNYASIRSQGCFHQAWRRMPLCQYQRETWVACLKGHCLGEWWVRYICPCPSSNSRGVLMPNVAVRSNGGIVHGMLLVYLGCCQGVVDVLHPQYIVKIMILLRHLIGHRFVFIWWFGNLAHIPAWVERLIVCRVHAILPRGSLLLLLFPCLSVVCR